MEKQFAAVLLGSHKQRMNICINGATAVLSRNTPHDYIPDSTSRSNFLTVRGVASRYQAYTGNTQGVNLVWLW